MKMSVRRIVLLVLSIIVLGFGLYNIISTIVQASAMREQVLDMLYSMSMGESGINLEGIVDVAIGITIAISCFGAAFFFATGILGVLASLKKYKGGAHIVLTWIYLVFCALGLLINVIGLIGGAQFSWTIIFSVLRVGVAIAFIVISKQIKEEEY